MGAKPSGTVVSLVEWYVDAVFSRDFDFRNGDWVGELSGVDFLSENKEKSCY